MTYLVLKGSAVLRLAFFVRVLSFPCACSFTVLGISAGLRCCLIAVFLFPPLPAPFSLVCSFIFSYFLHWTLVQCHWCLGRGWFWRMGLVVGLQVWQVLGCSTYLGLGLAAPASRYLGTQPPWAMQALIKICYHEEEFHGLSVNCWTSHNNELLRVCFFKKIQDWIIDPRSCGLITITFFCHDNPINTCNQSRKPQNIYFKLNVSKIKLANKSL